VLGKNKKIMAKNTLSEKGEIKAFLGVGSKFEGTLVFEEIVRMDGSFQGRITSNDTLIAGETACIEAEVNVGTFILSGRFKGSVQASRKVELRSPAVVEGTINTPLLAVEEGVMMNSAVNMRPPGEKTEDDNPENGEAP
jgi:cytoskeletal protein CcmA (bactofilin family)